jgi:hypothetical protein
VEPTFQDELVRYFLSLPPQLRQRILDDASGAAMGPPQHRVRPMPIDFGGRAAPVLGGFPEPPIPPSNGPPAAFAGHLSPALWQQLGPDGQAALLSSLGGRRL